MNKTKVLIVSVVTLMLLNVGLMAFFVVMKPRLDAGDGNGPRKIIIEKLHFDAPQQEEYAVLIDEHRGQIERMEAQIRQTKESLYSQLNQSVVDERVKDSLIAVLVDCQKQIENAHFSHFQKIKLLCNTPEQKEDFKDLAKQLGKLFSGNKKPRPNENGGRRPE
jgi:periplasmic protein CpxP/Spy